MDDIVGDEKIMELGDRAQQYAPIYALRQHLADSAPQPQQMKARLDQWMKCGQTSGKGFEHTHEHHHQQQQRQLQQPEGVGPCIRPVHEGDPGTSVSRVRCLRIFTNICWVWSATGACRVLQNTFNLSWLL